MFNPACCWPAVTEKSPIGYSWWPGTRQWQAICSNAIIHTIARSQRVNCSPEPLETVNCSRWDSVNSHTVIQDCHFHFFEGWPIAAHVWSFNVTADGLAMQRRQAIYSNSDFYDLVSYWPQWVNRWPTSWHSPVIFYVCLFFKHKSWEFIFVIIVTRFVHNHHTSVTLYYPFPLYFLSELLMGIISSLHVGFTWVGPHDTVPWLVIHHNGEQ